MDRANNLQLRICSMIYCIVDVHETPYQVVHIAQCKETKHTHTYAYIHAHPRPLCIYEENKVLRINSFYKSTQRESCIL